MCVNCSVSRSSIAAGFSAAPLECNASPQNGWSPKKGQTMLGFPALSDAYVVPAPPGENNREPTSALNNVCRKVTVWEKRRMLGNTRDEDTVMDDRAALRHEPGVRARADVQEVLLFLHVRRQIAPARLHDDAHVGVSAGEEDAVRHDRRALDAHRAERDEDRGMAVSEEVSQLFVRLVVRLVRDCHAADDLGEVWPVVRLGHEGFAPQERVRDLAHAQQTFNALIPRDRVEPELLAEILDVFLDRGPHPKLEQLV
eukprot:1583316-Rhodomonas_salina.1